MPKYIFIVFLFFQISLLYGQPGGNPYTARMTIVRGGYLEFAFNSMEKYENGIVFNNYTEIAICFSDPDNPGATGTEWKLEFEANTSGANFDGTSSLPLSSLQLNFTGIAIATYPGAAIPLSNAPSIAISDGKQGTEAVNVVYITYECGTETPLIGTTSGRNSIDIIFTLSAE